MDALALQGLTRRFGDRVAVDHLTLSIREGELFSLLGVNGAGKTTTIKLLTGLLQPTEGDALILGHSILSDPLKVKEITNLSPQETAIAPNLSVQENLEFFARVYGADAHSAKQSAHELMERFGLTERARDRAKTLSGGTQRRLSIAISLISSPKVLFLDEPTLGLDVLARRELWEAIELLHGHITVILTTHYMEEAETLSDRVGVMQAGKLVAVGTPQELIEKTGAKNFEDAFVQLATQKGGEQ